MDRHINPVLEKLTYLQFCKRYSASKVKPKPCQLLSELVPKNDELKTFMSVEFIVTHDFDFLTEVHLLPKVIQLRETVPGEPKYMKLQTPKVARFHKYSQIKTPHEFYFSELQLYCPFKLETELEPDCLERCKAKYDEISEHNGLSKISNVKLAVYPTKLTNRPDIDISLLLPRSSTKFNVFIFFIICMP